MSNYEEMADEALAILAQDGDETAEEFLIRKYKDVVRSKAHLYFMVGADSEDIVQEGMIGIFKAIRGYDQAKQASFHTFAEICINRQIITAVKRATRLKHSPLNTSVSLSRPLSDSEPDTTLEETLSSDSNYDPEALFLLKEDMDYIGGNGADIFSDLELNVWNEYLKGKSYLQIAESTGRSPKAIDNAIQRMKRKLELYLGR
ncbi:MAG TPA: RNA polymerase sporulation sigma factor SigH [Bacillota bacterium]|nr:RNA polymerase sporulation sigma factor SigH [Bacillota bacterium]